MNKNKYKIETLMNHVGENLDGDYGAVNPPILSIINIRKR